MIKAPNNGDLENIDKKNDTVKGLVDYFSEGAGEINIEGHPDQFINLY